MMTLPFSKSFDQNFKQNVLDVVYKNIFSQTPRTLVLLLTFGLSLFKIKQTFTLWFRE